MVVAASRKYNCLIGLRDDCQGLTIRRCFLRGSTNWNG